jgi:hypothetical protein
LRAIEVGLRALASLAFFIPSERDEAAAFAKDLRRQISTDPEVIAVGAPFALYSRIGMGFVALG